MTFYSGVLAPSLTPAGDYMAAVGAALLAEGFTLEATLGTSPITVKVYKSALAVNGVMDWYLYVRCTSDNYSTTGVTFHASEGFDGTNATNPCCGTQSVLPNGSWATGTSVAIGTTTSGMFNPLSLPVHRSGLEYWMSINPLRVIVSTRHHTNSNQDEVGYIGLFDSLVPTWTGPDLVTIRLWTGSTSSSSYGATSRDPFQTIVNAYNFFVWSTPASPNGPLMTAVDAYLGRSQAGPAVLYASRSSHCPRGQLKDVMAIPSNTSPAVLGIISGDELQIADIYGNEKTYVSFNNVGYGPGFYVRKDA